MSTEQEMIDLKKAHEIIRNARLDCVYEPAVIWDKLDRVAAYIQKRVNEVGRELYSEVLQ